MRVRLLTAAFLGAALLVAAPAWSPAAPRPTPTSPSPAPSPAGAPGPAPDDRLIVPGERIGKWSLDATIQDLTRRAGPPGVQEATEASRPPLLVYTWAPPGIAAVSRDRSKVEYLYLYGGSDYKTDKAIGPGSSAEAARRAYSRGAVSSLGSQRVIVWDGLGLAFLITPTRVTAVLIFRPGTAEGLRLPAIFPAPAPSPQEPRP